MSTNGIAIIAEAALNRAGNPVIDAATPRPTAIANADKPILMAKAFKDAVTSGRNAFLAGRMKKFYLAKASSPIKGII